jgi:hypothetical protein
MKNNIKALELIEVGLSSKTVSKLTETQINTLHSRLISEQASSTGKGTTTVSSKNPNAASIAKNLNSQGINVNMTEIDGEMEEGKIKKGEPNPWAICHAQVGPKKTRKFERCVMAVKKSLKEGKNPVSLFLESEIMRIVEKHIPPRITKGDLMKYISEDTKTKPKEKPGTKTPPKEKPHDPFKPSPHKQPKPKAKHETKESVMDAPAKPKERPTVKPGEKTPPREKPFDPFKPSPDKQPKPKAKSKLPEWLTFKNMGIKFK